MVNREVRIIRQVERHLTIEHSLNHGLRIERAIELYGQEMIENVVAGLIMITSQMFNLNNNITDDQAVMIAGDLVDRYPGETIEDVILTLKSIRTSGMKMYGKFDIETIFSEFDKTLDLKIYTREELLRKQKEEFTFSRIGSNNNEKELHHQAQVQYLTSKGK